MDSGESIYYLIPNPEIVPPKEPMHVSKHPGVVDPKLFEMGVAHRGRGTFGPANGQSKPSADTFLKSHTGEPVLPAPTKPTMTKTKIKAPVPTDAPVMGLVSSKNFITSNAVENILSQPKKVPVPQMLATSKPDYGKVPGYLKTIKSKITAEKEQIAEEMRAAEQAAKAGSMRKMSDDERATLVVELKMKWQRVNEAYQKLPFTLDTPMRRMRKEKYEAELTQLEKDIENLSRKTVLVAM